MALAAATTHTVNYTFVDRDGDTSVMTVHFDSALTPADLVSAAAALRALIVPLSNAVLIKQEVVIVDVEATYPATLPVEESDVERYGFFNFSTARKPVKSSISVPSLKNTYVIDGTETINTTNADVLAFTSFMVDGQVGIGNGPVGYAGDDITALFSAPIKKHRKNVAG